MAGPVRGVAGAAEAHGPDVTGRPGAVTPRPARRQRWAWVAGFTAAGIALFAAYVRLSATYPVNSDGANIILMSWDMLHGNVVLHNWWMSDVSFYTTELPEYVLIDAIRGLSPDVTHIAAALTYTLAVVLAALLAKGRASSREGLARVLLSGGIMLAPQLGVGIFALLLSVGHIGTAVPALAVWLLLDLAPRRWYIPVIAGVMLAWAMIADSLVLVVAIVPLVIVAVSRAVPLLAAGRPGPGSGTGPRLRSAWYELSLAAVAAAAWGASWLAGKAIHALGGYTLHAVPLTLVAPARLGVHAATTGDSLLALFGANFGGLHSGVAVAFAVLHLAGLAVVAWALARVFRRYATAALVDQLLAVAVIINLATYLFSSFSSGVLNGREIALILPFGAALAGRSIGPVLAQARPAPRAARLTLVLLAVLAGYAACLGYELAQPVSPPANARLASWLQDHHLDHGLSGYWQASVVTIDSGGQVTIRAVAELGGGIVPYRWEAKSTWYSPGQYANFVVLQNQPGFFNYWYPRSQVGATFGAPASTYQLGPYTVLVWTHNLMPALHRSAARTGPAGPA
jgi:hypothetical protein